MMLSAINAEWRGFIIKKRGITMNERENVIAVEKFRIELYGANYDCKMELMPSGAFHYGNQTCLLVTINDGAPPRFYDTRYEAGCSSAESFHKWSESFLRQMLDPACIITRAE